MIAVQVLIENVEKVKTFCAIISKESADFELIEGVHIVDAKSIMGIFSLDLSKPLQLKIYSDDQSILDKLNDYIVE